LSELDNDTAALLAAMQDSGAPPLHALSVTDARFALEGLTEPSNGQDDGVVTEDAEVSGQGGAIPVRIYRPSVEGADSKPVVLLFHGGGWALGSIETHEPMARSIASLAGVCVVSVDYRLAPEHPFPAGFDDCYTVLLWAASNRDKLGGPGAPILVAGDSAGGNLAAAVALAARDRGGPAIACQILFYPSVDAAGEGERFPSRELFGGGEYFLGAQDIIWLKDMYLTNVSDQENILVSPLRAPDLTNLPPALILTAGFDPLRDEGLAYHEKLCAAGVQSSHHCFEGTIHGFISFASQIAAGREGLDMAAAKIREFAE